MYFKNTFYSDGIDKFVVITVATEDNENLDRFRKSCSYYNIPYIILGLGDEWKSGEAENGVLLEPGGAQKIHYLREELKSWPDLEDHIILFTDSYDVVFNSSPKEILEKFRNFRTEVVFSTEKTCWPDENLASDYPKSSTEYKYLNSGGFIGYAPKIMEIIDVDIPIETDDQLFYTNFFLKNFKTDKIQIKPPIHKEKSTLLKFGYSSNDYNIGSMSEPYFDSEILEYLKDNFSKDTKILDVGAGDGKWGYILNYHFHDIEAVEIYEDYVKTHNLNEVYQKVYVNSVLDMDFEKNKYHVLILGDVFEHISHKDCVKFLSQIQNLIEEIIIVIPYKYTQEAESDYIEGKEGNIWGKHLQPDLTPETMAIRYPMLQLMDWTNQSDEMGKGEGFGWYTFKKEVGESSYIKLDYKQNLFQTLNQAIQDVELNEEGRFVNLVTSEVPSVIHANGPSWVKKYLREKSFYMFGEYNGDLGSINLMNKSFLRTDKKIFLSLFMYPQVQDINQVFDHIRFLDYPKSNITLQIVYDNEEYLYKIEKFIEKFGREYQDVKVVKNPNMVDSRKATLHDAHQNCDYLFMIDSNYIFRNNKSIQLLIEKELDIVSPMIAEENSEWVNFDLEPAYIKEGIQNYKSKTVFVVDFITGIIVVKNEALPTIQKLLDPIQGSDYDEWDWDVMFRDNAKIHNVILHLCNMNYYGGIIK